MKMFKTLRMRKTRQCTRPVISRPANKTISTLTPAPKDVDVEPPDDAPRPQDENVNLLPGVETSSVSSSGPKEEQAPTATPAPAQVLIAGGGIVGLLMAIALDKHLHVKAEIYEQAAGFDPDVGAGMGLYANGLRVIRDIDPHLLEDIQKAGHPYLYRRWERHDGTEVAVADEGVLGESQEESESGSALQTMGIRRWKLQQILHAAVNKAGIPIHFNKKVLAVKTPENGTTQVFFTDGSERETQLLIGADGGRSTVRSALLEKNFPKPKIPPKQDEPQMPTLSYTGVTCIMGVAEKSECSRRGISFPVSDTTKCHGAFYPTGATEQCFQFHFPIAATKQGSCDKGDSCWGNLSQQVSREECGKLAQILEADGWNEEKYLAPLRQVTRAVRVGFCQLTPPLKHWSFPNAQGQPRTVLIGDAAHPPVPYLGQGAQQGMEDVGTLTLLLKAFCLDEQGNFDLLNLRYATKVYEKLRIPRAKEILECGKMMGSIQHKRAINPAYNIVKEEKIQRDIFFHETMPIMFPGARHDYRQALEKELEKVEKQHNGPPLRTIAEG